MGKVLTLETMNPRIKDAEYAVRGELAIRAEKYKQVRRSLSCLSAHRACLLIALM